MKVSTKLLNFVFTFLLLGGLLFLLARPVLAQTADSEKNFSVNLETTYVVDASGDTRVSHNFKISNLNPTLFIKQYGIKLSSSQIENVVTRDNSGEEISAEVVSNNNQTSIGVTFPDQLVGQNKTRDFTISYNNPDIAVISGQVLEVSIPHQANEEEFNRHQVKVFTPLAYGLPTRAKPSNFQTKLSSDSKQIETTFESLSGSSASLLFGESQIFELQLKYSLENTTNTTKLSQIALPPDTPYQRVNYKLIEPLPQEIKRDPDGNWIATYTLKPNSSTVVNALAQVLITLEPDYALANVLNLEPGHLVPSDLPDQNKVWLSEQRFWPVNHQTINDISADLDGIKQIYDYVVKTLNYDFANINDEVERLGALGALATPEKALCQEFTDLFITLARNQDIPARRITGYAYTQNDKLRPLSLANDILHAWPEYYDNQTKNWVPVDPTWEKTSGGVDYFHQFDLNHIVFAINNQSSSSPYPAGSYKLSGQDSKDIGISFSNQFLPAPTSYEFKIDRGKLVIFNQTGLARYNLNLILQPENDQIKLSLNSPLAINSILPFEKKEFKINAYSKGIFWPKSSYINIYYEDQVEKIAINVQPELFAYTQNPYLILGLGAGSVAVALLAGSLLVFNRKRRSSLRRQSKKSR